MTETSQGRLAGRVAIVTGAASGIGRETTQVFAREGASVVAVDVPGADLAFDSPSIQPCERDITATDAPDVIVSHALDAFGQLDILFNNAGMSERSVFADMTAEFWDRTLEVNLRAAFRLTQAAVPHLQRSPHGRIISTASVSAIRSLEGLGAYAASKAGLAAFTRSLALELGPSGITANSIMPGATRTKMTAQTLGNPEYADAIIRRCPLGRLGAPADIAAVALFLASDDSRFVTGQAIIVDGGVSIRA